MNKKLLLLSVLVILLALPAINQVYGQSLAGLIGEGGSSSSGSTIDFAAILDRVAGILWIIFAGLVIIMFLIIGMLYLTAQGDPEKVRRANRTIIWAIIGVAVGILAYSAYNIVYSLIFG